MGCAAIFNPLTLIRQRIIRNILNIIPRGLSTVSISLVYIAVRSSITFLISLPLGTELWSLSLCSAGWGRAELIISLTGFHLDSFFLHLNHETVHEIWSRNCNVAWLFQTCNSECNKDILAVLTLPGQTWKPEPFDYYLFISLIFLMFELECQ